MKMLAKVLDKKQNKNEFEEGWEQAIKKSYNISDEKYIQPLIKCLQDE
jgi:hypothetical protein